MQEFIFIITNILLPILILIAAGFIFQKIFKTDVRTFSRLVVYLLIPVMIFVRFYQIESLDAFFIVIPFVLLLQAVMYIVALVVSVLAGYTKSIRNAFINSMVLLNTGNYGIPLIELVFKGHPVAAASQMFIVVTQNITSNTFGVFYASAGSASRKAALKNMLKMPAIYVIALITVIKIAGFEVPQPVLAPLSQISNAFIAFALITLGVQLAEVRPGGSIKKVLAVSLIKVTAAPLAGFGIALLLGIEGLLAQALIIGISTPTAVNSAIIAGQFGNEPDFAAQVVFTTTLLCTFTIPLVIYLCGIWF